MANALSTLNIRFQIVYVRTYSQEMQGAASLLRQMPQSSVSSYAICCIRHAKPDRERAGNVKSAKKCLTLRVLCKFRITVGALVGQEIAAHHLMER
jgi:hypothetical protein